MRRMTGCSWPKAADDLHLKRTAALSLRQFELDAAVAADPGTDLLSHAALSNRFRPASCLMDKSAFSCH